MTGDDRCPIASQSTTAPSPSTSSIGSFGVHGKETFVAVFGAVFVLAIVFSTSILYLRWKWHLLPQQRQNDERSSIPSSSSPPSGKLIVPFVVLHDPVGRETNANGSNRKPISQILRSVMENYRGECSQALSGLSTMLDTALTSETNNGFSRHRKYWNRKDAKLLSTKIERRIERTAKCIEHDEQILAKLLGNFPYVLALPDKETVLEAVDDESIKDSTDEVEVRAGSSSTKYSLPRRNKKGMNEADTQSYDSATQIWAHIVRDWTVEGKFIRHIIYDWCYEQMEKYCQKPSYKTNVLVPGSGMGRLAFDLFQMGYIVEANELSPSMAAAAWSVLANQVSGSFHPYVLDSMANEVDSKRRFDFVRFPDVPIQSIATIGGENRMVHESTGRGSLSYTVGNFVGNDDDYYRRQRVGHFDVIVTCFFIDTATNIYEYLDTIQKLLRSGTGVWINVGPVQWHHNAVLRPSVDELKELIEACGWTIRVWSIDTTPVSYRNENDVKSLPRMTSYDGYRPLRFVAIRSK